MAPSSTTPLRQVEGYAPNASHGNDLVKDVGLWFDQLMQDILPHHFSEDSNISFKQEKDLSLFLRMFRHLIVPAEMAQHDEACTAAGTRLHHPFMGLHRRGFALEPQAQDQPLSRSASKRRADDSDETLLLPNVDDTAEPVTDARLAKRLKTSKSNSEQAEITSGFSNVRCHSL